MARQSKPRHKEDTEEEGTDDRGETVQPAGDEVGHRQVK